MAEVERAVNPNNIYVGMRYVPIYDGEWSQRKDYESLVIVTYNNDTYISNSPVPANTEITNTTYWSKMYGGNQQLEDVHTLVEGFQTQLDNMNDKLDELGQGGYVWKPALAYNMSPGTDITAQLKATSSGENIGFSAGEYTISEEIVIFPRCYFAPGAILKSSNKVVFANDVVAGPWQIFNIGNPADPVVYKVPNKEIRPEWYGNFSSSSNDVSYFFSAALNGQGPGKTLLLSNTFYSIQRPITLDGETNIIGNNSTITFGENGSITFAVENALTSIPQIIIEKINIESENTNPVFHVSTSHHQVVIKNCGITGNFLIVDSGGISSSQINEIIFSGNFIMGETVTISSLNSELAGQSNQWRIYIKDCIFSNSSNTMLLSSNNIAALKSEVYLENCITSSSPAIYSYGNLHIINNFPTTVRGTHFIGKDTDITLDASNGSTVTFEASHCNLTMGGPGITIDLGGCGDIMSCNLKGTQPFNFQAVTKGSRVIISKTFINSEGTVNLTGTNGWDNGVLITDCNFGSDRVINSPNTFVFNNSPWGGSVGGGNSVLPWNHSIITSYASQINSSPIYNATRKYYIIIQLPSDISPGYQSVHFDFILPKALWNEINEKYPNPVLVIQGSSEAVNITYNNNTPSWSYINFNSNPTIAKVGEDHGSPVLRATLRLSVMNYLLDKQTIIFDFLHPLQVQLSSTTSQIVAELWFHAIYKFK